MDSVAVRRRDEELNLELHPRQQSAFNTIATELLYGGAAGGGKSHLMRVAAAVWCAQIPGLQVYLFRRQSVDLEKNHLEGPSGFRELLSGWVKLGWVVIVAGEIRFWNGSKIYLCHCKDEKDRFKYQGAEIHLLLIDELTHFTEKIYRYLRTRVRAPGLNVPPEYAGMFPRIMCGSNPGNVGHSFVKAFWIDNAGEYALRRMSRSEGGLLRQFIPARLDDNPSMRENDPDYEARLEGAGSDALVRALRDGDWDVVEGAFFDKLSRKRNSVHPFTIPADWMLFGSFDWGYAKPYSYGLWAIVADDTTVEDGFGNDTILPRGCLVRVGEDYGCVKGSPNVGTRLEDEEQAARIKILEGKRKVSYRVADPSIWSKGSGPSTYETFVKEGLHFKKADNTRVGPLGHNSGWAQVRSRIAGDEDGRPMMVAFSTCKDWWRTLPVIQHDENRPEDLDTNAEDHAADETRYAALSRPWAPVRRKKEDRKPNDYVAATNNSGTDGWI